MFVVKGFPEIFIVIVPVLIFLAGLFLLDSFKLVKPGAILISLFFGCIIAFTAYLINHWLLTSIKIDPVYFQRYAAPFIEESLKFTFLVFIIKSNKVGFAVDSAIIGFSVGAGFSVIENLYYLQFVPESNLLIWLIRGFGTAILHGGTVSLAAIISKNICEWKNNTNILNFIPGLSMAIIIHSLFNFFLLTPVLSTLLILILFPILLYISFESSEKLLKKWLGIGFDSDVQILEMIRSGKVLNSRIGDQLIALKSKISGEILADILCYMRIFVELSINAKGTLLMKESGFRVKRNIDIENKFREFEYLKKSIGRTGILIVRRFLHTTSRDLWQIYMLQGLIDRRGIKKQ